MNTRIASLLLLLGLCCAVGRAGADDDAPAATQPDDPTSGDKTPADDKKTVDGKAETAAGGIGLTGAPPESRPAGVQNGRGNSASGDKASSSPSSSAPAAAASGAAPDIPPPGPEYVCQSYVCHAPRGAKSDFKEPCMPAKDRNALIQCVHAQVNPQDERGAFEVTRRVAWALRGECAGLLLKPAGSNIVAWRGGTFSASRIAYPNGHIIKILSDVGAGGKNAPSWQDEDCIDWRRYVPAINPTLP